MTILPIRNPGPAAFSGNPMVYSFAIAPYAAAQIADGIRLQVQVEVEDLWGSGQFIPMYGQSLTPDAQGMVVIDVASVLDACLKFFTPPLNLNVVTVCPEQTKRYRIKYTLANNSTIVVAAAYTTVAVAIKGGFTYGSTDARNWLANTTQYLNAAFDPNNDNTDSYIRGEYRFAWLLMRSSIVMDVDTVLKLEDVNFDGTISADADYNRLTLAQWRVYCLPLTPSIILTDADPTRLFALNADAAICQPLKLEKDYRPVYGGHQLIYRTSLGALDTITLRGEADFENDYQRSQYAQVAFPDEYANGLLRGRLGQQRAIEQRSIKAATGFLSKYRADSLADLLLSEEVYEVMNGKLVPVIVNTSNVKLYSNSDRLFALEIQYSPAYSSQYYTPVLALPGTTCPAVMAFEAFQLTKTSLCIIWALYQPYSSIQVEITIEGVTTSYTYTGNSGKVEQPITNPATDTPISITVKGRTICNRYSDPIDTGAWTTRTVSIIGDQPPVAVDDTITIPSGFTTPITLGTNALLNDYDPDGEPLECQAVTGGTTDAGGTYSINAAGVVSYAPPSSSFTGPDFFMYTIQNPGGTLTSTAKYTINVGSSGGGGSTGLYLRIIEVDAYYIERINAVERRASVYAYFYSDTDGSVAYDPAALSVVYTVNRNNATFIDGSLDSDTDTTLTFTAAGIRQLVYSGRVFIGYTDSDTQIADTFTINPGSGYTVI